MLSRNTCLQFEQTNSLNSVYDVKFTSETTCSGLPQDWSDLTTSANFPVGEGHVIPITCDVGHVVVGDKYVTCQIEDIFEYEIRPSCKDGELSHEGRSYA